MQVIADAHTVAGSDENAAHVKRFHHADVTFIGALPPPITGMAAFTKVIVDELERRTSVRKFDWSRGKPLKGRRWKLARFWGAIKSVFGLALAGPARGAKLYHPVSAGWGLYTDLAIAAVGRLMGYRLVLHHHVYTYITRHDWRVAWLDRLTGRTGAHVVHCELMREDFLCQYDSMAQFLIVPPTVTAQQLELLESQCHSGFTIGFLSNLTFGKGLREAIETFERLTAEGRQVRLIMAGPCLSNDVQKVVDEVIAKWPGQVEYLGPVYGREKSQFYANLDAFVFPTRHRHESWGIVLNEALAFGCPVIARSIGCVKWIVQDGCGMVVESDADFVAIASELISQWIDNPQPYQAARAAARGRANVLEEQAQRELPEFIDTLLAMGQVVDLDVDARGASLLNPCPSPNAGATAEPSRA